MTYTKLFGFGILLAGVLVVLRIIFSGYFTWADSFQLHVVYWLVVWVLATALVRRLSVITMLEAVVALVLWLIFMILFDVAIAGPVIGWGVLIDPNFALGYLFMPLAVILFHKKRHVARREQLAKK